ncbi:hypothetical protein GLA29479_4755 [Lysobacter antibioticus]|uniref:hypothetical protein n=1 Tax=Lysobacter antibioticus TaxID=84531 RepID=UPI0007221ED8|nr:hypothetical protein [Lysobacter antibioticus]ALN65585.1 hypothetical protein GLA29479_4755 [Lysobacter antibioticus]
MTYQPQYPAELQPFASRLMHELEHQAHPTIAGPDLLIRGERLSLPCRLYCAPGRLRSIVDRETGDARLLAQCLGTRHCDGHVREKYLRDVLGVDRTWVAPFVVQLLGEYVIEIVDAIATSLNEAVPAHLQAFAGENPGFMATTRRRVISYWDCYHRRRYPSLRDYPGMVALETIDAAR